MKEGLFFCEEGLKNQGRVRGVSEENISEVTLCSTLVE